MKRNWIAVAIVAGWAAAGHAVNCATSASGDYSIIGGRGKVAARVSETIVAPNIRSATVSLQFSGGPLNGSVRNYVLSRGQSDGINDSMILRSNGNLSANAALTRSAARGPNQSKMNLSEQGFRNLAVSVAGAGACQ
jgi:hypothetical protein